MAESKTYSNPIACGHCGSTAIMEVVVSHLREHYYMRGEERVYGDRGDCLELLECPNCEKITLRTYFWDDGMEDEEVASRQERATILFPNGPYRPMGLPEAIAREHNGALRVRLIDANAYGVLLRRVLHAVCEDRKAEGKYLSNQLEDLSKKGEIPNNLVAVVTGLKDLGNVGAHPDLGDLPPEALPVLDGLCRAVLEFVYSGPHLAHLAAEAERLLATLKEKARVKSAAAEVEAPKPAGS